MLFFKALAFDYLTVFFFFFDYLFIFRTALWPSAGEELISWLSPYAILRYAVVIVGVFSSWVFKTGCGIRLNRFLIIAFSSSCHSLEIVVLFIRFNSKHTKKAFSGKLDFRVFENDIFTISDLLFDARL